MEPVQLTQAPPPTQNACFAMNACQSLPAVLIVLATISSPLNGRRAYAQDSEPVKEQASNAQAIPGRDMIPGEEFNENLGADIASEVAKSNPFVPATAPAEDTVNPELAPSKPLPAAQAIIPSEKHPKPSHRSGADCHTSRGRSVCPFGSPCRDRCPQTSAQDLF